MKKIISILLALTLFAPMVFAEENSFESLVLDIIKKNPQIIKDALEKYEQEVAEKQKEEEFKKLLEDKVQVEIGKSAVRGNKSAEYTVIAFTDFQCPFCKRGDDTVKQLREKYGDKIKYIFKNFPLSFHPEATPASKAAIAAGKQGKFYEYHDKLFENQGKLGEELYVQIANELTLNIEKFNKDRASEEVGKQIQEETKQGQDIGINGTPGFVLNGVKIYGAYPLDYFEKIISSLEQEKTAKK